MYLSEKTLGDLPVFLEDFRLLSNDKKSKMVNVSYCVYCIVVNIVLGASIVYAGFESSLRSNMFYAAIGIITLSVHVHFILNQKKLKNFLHLLKVLRKIRKEEWEDEMFDDETLKLWRMYHSYYKFLVFYSLAYTFVTFLGDFLLGYFAPDSPSIRLPIAGQGFIDATEPRSLNNFFVSTIAIFSIMATIFPYLGTEGFLLFSIIYARTELKLLNRKVTLVKDGLRKEYKELDVDKKIIDIVKQHQFFLKVVDSLNELIGFPVFIKYTTTSFCLCLSLFSVSKVLTTAEYGGSLTGVTAICCLGSLLLLLSIVGESLETENSKLLYNIYDLPWYHFKPKYRKTLKMIMRQVEQTCIINYYGVVSLNLNAYMQVINASYSYFMLLKSTM